MSKLSANMGQIVRANGTKVVIKIKLTTAFVKKTQKQG
jgi:hypothetical protein